MHGVSESYIVTNWWFLNHTSLRPGGGGCTRGVSESYTVTNWWCSQPQQLNLPGYCWAEIQQLALVGSSSSLHFEACNALGASDGVIHSSISLEVVCLRATANFVIIGSYLEHHPFNIKSNPNCCPGKLGSTAAIEFNRELGLMHWTGVLLTGGHTLGTSDIVAYPCGRGNSAISDA